jgi:hypothetical protein
MKEPTSAPAIEGGRHCIENSDGSYNHRVAIEHLQQVSSGREDGGLAATRRF